jgi:hypothetical protein
MYKSNQENYYFSNIIDVTMKSTPIYIWQNIRASVWYLKDARGTWKLIKIVVPR